ncbi:MAG: putative peptidoglycan glycosyltransferase FtsW [Eubacteriales bacterium]|nr:putative peptidoglycan glycosyltransferase FtsW [Eubacteriales bacterium]
MKKSPDLIRKKGTSLSISKSQGTIIRLIGEVDRPFLVIVVALLCIGSVMIFSASYAFAENEFNDSYYFARKQLGWVVAGLAIMGFVAKFVDYRWIKKWAFVGYIFSLVLNFLVPVIGVEVKGAIRQVDLGFINFQPSELMKFFVILILAAYVSDNHAQIRTFRKGVMPFIIFGGMAAASIMVQRHLSATIIICLIVLVMMYLSGTKGIWVGGALGAGVAAVAFVLTGTGREVLGKLVPHAVKRLQVWEDPIAYMRDAETNWGGWQPSQSLFAISSGGFWGLGLGQSIEKYGYLPEPQNDYIFAILCEELGFFGATMVIGLFIAFAWRGFKIAKNAPNRFTSLLVMGITSQVVLQVILNIAVVTNTIPSTGIGLPFFSYGGTNLIILLAEMGIILSISRYSYLEKGQ